MATPSSFRYRLDGQVTLTLILVGALSLFVLAFRFKNHRPCPNAITINTEGGYFQGASLKLTAFANGAESFEWDFGDGTSESSTSPTVVHSYLQTGRFTVKVTVNGRCEEWKEVRIIPKPVTPTDIRQLPVFTGPDSALVNALVTFTDQTPDATSWEWRFGEAGGIGEVVSTDREVRHIFKTPGYKDVYLKVNGSNERVSIHKIEVKPDPKMTPSPQPKQPKPAPGPRFNPIINEKPVTPSNEIVPEQKEAVKAPEVSSAVLGEMLKQVSSGRKSVADFADYLCGNPNIQVVYNNKQMTFSEMCAVIRKIDDEDDIKSVSVIQHKDENLCIKSLTVTFKMRGWLGRRTH